MIVFSDVYELDLNVKNNAGWSFNYIILIQVVVNIALYAGEGSYKAYKITKLKWE